MLSMLKANGRSLAALFLVAQCLIYVGASPMDLDATNGNDLLARQFPAKYVGSRCSSSAECYSRNCVTENDGVTNKCRRQPSGGPCFEKNNCGSRICDFNTGTCTASGLGGKCDVPADCSKGGCINGKCTLLALGGRCREGYECESNQCGYASDTDTSGTCEVASFFIACLRNELCYTNQCVPTRCPNTKDDTCRFNACTAVPIGGTCRTTYDCRDEQLCTPDTKQCLTRNDRECASSAECASGNCSSGYCVA